MSRQTQPQAERRRSDKQAIKDHGLVEAALIARRSRIEREAADIRVRLRKYGDVEESGVTDEGVVTARIADIWFTLDPKRGTIAILTRCPKCGVEDLLPAGTLELVGKAIEGGDQLCGYCQRTAKR